MSVFKPKKKGYILSTICLLWLCSGCGNFDESGAEQTDAIVDTTEGQLSTEWLIAEKELQFPFDLETEVYMPERHVVPEEALQVATTESLLRAVKQYTDHFTTYLFYNLPSDYLVAAERFNAAGELEQREDVAEVLLTVYEEENLEKEDEIVLEEIFLAANFVFEQTDEEMRKQILEAVMEKVQMRRVGTDTADHPCGFFAYITEMKDTDASLWYAYIMEESSNTSAKACLEDYESITYWPYISRPIE